MAEVLEAMPASRRNRSPEMAALLEQVERKIIPQERGDDADEDQRGRSYRGGISWLARKLGIKKQAISRWHRVPVDRVPTVSRLTGIPRSQIRPDKPDIFPPDPRAVPLARRQRKVRAG